MPMIAAKPTTDHIATSPVVHWEVSVAFTVGMKRFATKTIPKTKLIIPPTKFAILNHP